MSNSEPTNIADRYKLLERIGSGGFADTWRGHDSLLDVEVAVKVFFDNDPERAERGLKEARSLARYTRLPGIVSVRDFVRDGDQTYLVMDYVKGVDLINVIDANKRMSIEQIVSVLEPVADALQTLHEDGYLHRDVSPENIRVQPDGTGVLIDFGSVLDLGQKRRGTIIVKPGYAPLEQYGDSSTQGPWTDVYALAATIYHCLCGLPPTDSMQRNLSDDLKTPSELGVMVPRGVETALMQGLALDYHERTQTVAELMAGLASEGNTATPDGTVAPRPTESMSTAEEIPHSVTEAEQQPKPHETPATEPEPDPVPSDTTRSGGQPPRPKREEGRKPTPNAKVKRWLPFAAAGVVIAIIVAVIVVANSTGNVPLGGRNPYADETISSGNTYSSVRGEKITNDIILQIGRDGRTHQVFFEQCEISDEQIKLLSEQESIQYVNLYECTGFTTLDPLAHMDKLKSLDIRGMDNVDLNEMFPEDMPQVETLEINQLRAKEGTEQALAHFSALTTLRITETEGISGCAYLENMPNLSVINLSGIKIPESDLRNLADRKSLRSAKLSDCGLSSLDWVASCPKLETLNISGNNITNEIASPLSTCRELKWLGLAHNDLTDASFCESLTKLVGLDLSHNQVADVSKLASSAKIQYLILNNNRIPNIEALANGFSDLTVLNIAFNEVTSLKPLQQCNKLKHLVANNNKLTSLDGLQDKSELESLLASYNQIADISAISSSISRVTALDLGRNQISDISALSGLAKSLSGGSTNVGLDYNNITSVESLPRNVSYGGISLYGNPVTDLAGFMQSAKGWGALYLPYSEGATYGNLERKSSALSTNIVGVPYDHQVQVERAVKGEKGYVNLEFPSVEEADDALKSLRDELNKKVSGAVDSNLNNDSTSKDSAGND